MTSKILFWKLCEGSVRAEQEQQKRDHAKGVWETNLKTVDQRRVTYLDVKTHTLPFSSGLGLSITLPSLD